MQTLPRVYAITPALEFGDKIKGLIGRIVELLEDGWLVQLRQKKWSGRQLLEILAGVQRLAAPGALARLLVNDRCDVALCLDGPGVHLPEAGMPVDLARRLLGPERLIGVSCHNERRLAEAGRLGADLATIGPIFETPGKGPKLGCEAIRRMQIPPGIAVYGLGGIDEASAGQLAGTRLHGIACIRAVFDTAEPTKAARALEREFLDGRHRQ